MSLHSLSSVAGALVVISTFLLLAHSRPMYSDDGMDNQYLQMLAAIQRGKQQGYMGQVYDQFYDNYEYPDSAYQDYVRERLREQQMQNSMQQYGDYGAEEEAGSVLDLEVSSSWPAQRLTVGQVVGVAVDSESNPHIFHRGDRVWGAEGKRLFDENHQYLAKDEGPIKQPTVLQLSQEDGSVVKQWGEDRFYLPHGLTIDNEGNFWLTDVALHQVFKFEPDKPEPTLVLGEAFQPAADNQDAQRFCQPTDVAVSSEGDIFVADGYCNRRIAKFDSSGNLMGQIPLLGDSGSVPHSITLAEQSDLVCVADREERSILCFNAGINQPDTFGTFEREYSDPNIGRIFAIEYNSETGLLHAVTDDSGAAQEATGFTINLHQKADTADIIDEWSPYNRGFSSPHDVAVSPEGNTLYVGEISPNYIWRFVDTETLEPGMEEVVGETQGEQEEESDEKDTEGSEGHDLDLEDTKSDEGDLEEAEKPEETEESEEEGEHKDQRGEELEQELEKEEEQLNGAEQE